MAPGKGPEPGSAHQPKACGHTEAPQPSALGLAQWAQGVRGQGCGIGTKHTQTAVHKELPLTSRGGTTALSMLRQS